MDGTGSLIGAGARLLSEKITLMVPPSGRSNLLERMVESTIEAFNTNENSSHSGIGLVRFLFLGCRHWADSLFFATLYRIGSEGFSRY